MHTGLQPGVEGLNIRGRALLYRRNRLMTLRKQISSVLLLLFCCVAYASAHPLGNFTINHFARLDIQSERIRIHYVIDMAEIPAFQELQKLGTTAPSQEM